MDPREIFRDDAHKKAADAIDKMEKYTDEEGKSIKSKLGSPEIRKVKDNLKFINKLEKNPIKKDKHAKTIFGKVIDPLPVVFGNNIWNRSIFITDELNDLYTSGTIEMMQKYVKKKRKIDSKMLFILLLIGGGGFVVFLIILIFLGVF